MSLLFPDVEPAPRPTGGEWDHSFWLKRPDDLTRGFIEFWELYPKRVSKGAARRAWVKARRDASAVEIMAGVARSIFDWRKKRTEKEYVPHPATWLNGCRWEDELEEPPAPVEPGELDIGGGLEKW